MPEPSLRGVRVLFGSPAARQPRFTAHRSMAQQTTVIITAFYAVTFVKFYAYSGRYLSWDGDVTSTELLWPVQWMPWVGQDFALSALGTLSLFAGAAGLFWWRALWARILVSLMLLQYAALANQAGAINHEHHEWFWVSVVFCFLPGGAPAAGLENRAWRVRLILVFAAAGGLITMFYALSGFWKVLDATTRLIAGEFGGFHPEAMAVTLARRSFETGTTPLLADAIISVPWLGWPLYLGLYYIELVAIIVIFRPELVRLWGAMLIAFHVGTLVFMSIPFPDHVLINGLLFWMAPWAVQRPTWREMAVTLPLFGPLLRLAISSPGPGGRGGVGLGRDRISARGS